MADDFAQRLLGKDETLVRTSSGIELCNAIDSMVAQAGHSIRILSHDTEPELYGRSEFTDLLAGFIGRRRKVAKIRVLIADPARALRSTHRLVALWHRFPSFIDLRELRDEYARTREAFLVVDEIGLVRRQDHEAPEAVISFRNIPAARDRAAWFDEAFARGAASTSLRRLSL